MKADKQMDAEGWICEEMLDIRSHENSCPNTESATYIFPQYVVFDQEESDIEYPRTFNPKSRDQVDRRSRLSFCLFRNTAR